MNINDLFPDDASMPDLPDEASLPDLPEDVAGRQWIGPGWGDRACATCVGNPTLERVAFSHLAGARCSLCGADASFAAPIDVMLEYVYRSLLREYADPAGESIPIDPDTGEYFLVDVYTTEELLEALGESFANHALTDLLSGSVDHEWVSIDGVADSVSDRMVGSWRSFEQRIQTGPRFLFAADQATFGEASFEQFQHFLQAMSAQLGTQIVRQHSAGLALFRARWSPTKTYSTPDELGSPGPENAGPQRLSASGVPCFYAAEDVATATSEIRPAADSIISSGRWRTTRALVVIDFAAEIELPSIFDHIGASSRTHVSFLRDFAFEISRPTGATGVPANDYLGTQVLAEYFRYGLSTPYGQGVDAVRYRSSIHAVGANWCLFGPLDRTDSPAVELEVATSATR